VNAPELSGSLTKCSTQEISQKKRTLRAHELLLKRLSQDVEMLTSQNEALNQHNQEMLNQLTEADREIERLKAELSSRYTEPHHLPEVEQQGKMRLEDLEKELNSKNQQLLDAQTLITSLEENLREKVAAALVSQATLEAFQQQQSTGSKQEQELQRHAEPHVYDFGDFAIPEMNLIRMGQAKQVPTGKVVHLTQKLQNLEVGLSGMQKDQELQKQLLSSSEEEVLEYERRLTVLMDLLSQMKAKTHQRTWSSVEVRVWQNNCFLTRFNPLPENNPTQICLVKTLVAAVAM